MGELSGVSRCLFCESKKGVDTRPFFANCEQIINLNLLREGRSLGKGPVSRGFTRTCGSKRLSCTFFPGVLSAWVRALLPLGCSARGNQWNR